MLLDEDVLTAKTPEELPREITARAGWKDGHRQLPATIVATGEPSWWTTKPPKGFTAEGAKATERSRHSRAAMGIGLTHLKGDL